jgi:hypothetical protein
MNRKLLFAIVLPFIALASVVQASVVVPTGLNPGDQYYLTFVTSGTRDALSTSLSVYDTFVQAQAASNPSLTGTSDGVQWKVIGSTASESAVNHLGLLEKPIYLLNGTTLVATGATDFWDGTHSAGINIKQDLSIHSFLTFTGSLTNGDANPLYPLGAITSLVMSGYVSTSDNRWIQDGAISGGTQSFYAMSQLLQVPGGPVPEPASVIVWSLLVLSVGGTSWRRRRKHAA